MSGAKLEIDHEVTTIVILLDIMTMNIPTCQNSSLGLKYRTTLSSSRSYGTIRAKYQDYIMLKLES